MFVYKQWFSICGIPCHVKGGIFMDGWNLKTFLIVLLLSPFYIASLLLDFAKEHEFIALMLLLGFTGIIIFIQERRDRRARNIQRAVYNREHGLSGIPLPNENDRNTWK